MYQPAHFEESQVQVLHHLIRVRPLGTLVTFSSGTLEANHIPFHLSPVPEPYGALQGHVARANPVWRQVNQEPESLVIFNGPEAYISPSWYPTKREQGKVVPTWNYVVVHARGVLRIIDDPDWVRNQVDALTTDHESALETPWSLEDAPSEYIERLTGAIVGIELVITRLEGKWKLSQNQPIQNQAGVMEGLENRGGGNGLEVAALIRQRLEKTPQ